MKSKIFIIGGLFLLVTGFGPVFAETYGDESVATLANDAGLSLEGLRRDAGLFYDVPQASVTGETAGDASDDGLLTCHFTDGCGYAVNPQVMIDLQYSIVSLDEEDRYVARNGLDGDRLAPNLMLGLHINF